MGEVEACYDGLILGFFVGSMNLSAYSMSIPSGEVRIKPAPLPCAFEAPSTESFHIGGLSSK